jgi:hypothetical protein
VYQTGKVLRKREAPQISPGSTAILRRVNKALMLYVPAAEPIDTLLAFVEERRSNR